MSLIMLMLPGKGEGGKGKKETLRGYPPFFFRVIIISYGKKVGLKEKGEGEKGPDIVSVHQEERGREGLARLLPFACWIGCLRRRGGGGRSSQLSPFLSIPGTRGKGGGKKGEIGVRSDHSPLYSGWGYLQLRGRRGGGG